jgi:hypothetical protein
MIDRLQYDIEINGSAATMYLGGPLEMSDVPFLRVLCAAIPSFVRVLRVDLLAMRSPSPDGVGAVREILHDWRAQRRGEFQLLLCTAHLVATYRAEADDIVPAPFGSAYHDRDRLMATHS